MVKSHRLAFDFGEPFVVDRFDNHPAKVVFNAKVSFVFPAFCFVLCELSFSDDFVRVDGLWVRSWVRGHQESVTVSSERDIFCFINHHAHMAMLSASILGCDAASSIGEFFCEQI